MWRALLGASLVACGRLGFDPTSAAIDATDATDALADVGPCGRKAIAPPTIALGGETFRYTTFDNQRAPVPDASVTVIDDEGSLLGAVSSNLDGSWALNIPTGGAAIAPIVKFAATGFFTTRLHVDIPLDGDAVAPSAVALWTLPHGPLWNAMQMTGVYGNLATRDPMRATMNIAVRDCRDAVVTGVTVVLSPPAERLVYQADDGTLDPNLMKTTGPFGHAIALNVPPGTIAVRASKDGATFYEQDVVVAGGDFNELVVLRALD